MKPILLLLLLALPTTADAKPIRAQTLREMVITALKEDRETMIVLIEVNSHSPDHAAMVARYKEIVAADERRIKELGGTVVPWVYSGGAPTKAGALTGGGAISCPPGCTMVFTVTPPNRCDCPGSSNGSILHTTSGAAVPRWWHSHASRG